MFKVCQIKGRNIMIAMLANYAWAALVFWARLLMTAKSSGHEVSAIFVPDAFPFALCCLMGLLYVSGFIVTGKSTAICGVALTSASGRSALVLPVLLSWLFLGDQNPSWAVIILIIIAMAMMTSSKTNGREPRKEGITLSKSLILVALFLIYGINDFSLKLSQHMVRNATAGEDTLINARLTGITALVFTVAFIIALVMCIRKQAFKDSGNMMKDIMAGAIIGIANSCNTFMVLNALGKMSAAVFYPIYNASVVLVCTLIGLLIFREKPRKIQAIGMCIAVIAVTLNYL